MKKITIREDVQVGNAILEVGDVIQVLNEVRTKQDIEKDDDQFMRELRKFGSKLDDDIEDIVYEYESKLPTRKVVYFVLQTLFNTLESKIGNTKSKEILPFLQKINKTNNENANKYFKSSEASQDFSDLIKK